MGQKKDEADWTHDSFVGEMVTGRKKHSYGGFTYCETLDGESVRRKSDQIMVYLGWYERLDTYVGRIVHMGVVVRHGRAVVRGLVKVLTDTGECLLVAPQYLQPAMRRRRARPKADG